MIAAISLMQRRPDVAIAEFRKHWLDPHGVMTAELPRLRHYVQSHCVPSPATNALARELAIDGIPELWFESIEDRRIAYTSPRIAECNIDSEQFIGAVSRLVTEPLEIITPPATATPAKAFIVAVGAPDVAWADATQARVTRLPGVTGYLRHRLIEQMAAPNSRVAELKLRVAGIAAVTFESLDALARNAGQLAGDGGDAARVAIYGVEDFRLV